MIRFVSGLNTQIVIARILSSRFHYERRLEYFRFVPLIFLLLSVPKTAKSFKQSKKLVLIRETKNTPVNACSENEP